MHAASLRRGWCRRRLTRLAVAQLRCGGVGNGDSDRCTARLERYTFRLDLNSGGRPTEIGGGQIRAGGTDTARACFFLELLLGGAINWAGADRTTRPSQEALGENMLRNITETITELRAGALPTSPGSTHPPSSVMPIG